jgi:hypothetical protein
MLPILSFIANDLLRRRSVTAMFSGFGNRFFPTQLGGVRCGESFNKQALSMIALALDPTGFHSRRQVGSTWALARSECAYFKVGLLFPARAFF